MKRTTLFLLLVAFAGCLTAYPQKKEAPKRQGWNDYHDYGPLYGNVESITITRYELTDKFGEITKEEVREKEFYKFNLKGNVVEQYKYDRVGSQNYKYLNKYDSQGNKIEKASHNADGALYWKTLYKYDSQGNCIEEVGIKCMNGNMIPVIMEERVIVYRK